MLEFLSHMNHVSVSPTDGNGPTQGQRKTLTRVGIEPCSRLTRCSRLLSDGLLPSDLVDQSVERRRSNPKVVGSIPTLVRVFLCPCVGPFPSVGLTLTLFIWDRNSSTTHYTLFSWLWSIKDLLYGIKHQNL